MRLVGNTFLDSSWAVGALLDLPHISSAGGGHHVRPGLVIAIYPPSILALVHKWQPLSEGRLL